MNTKKDLKCIMALGHMAALINIREALTRIRESRIEEAINGMEIFLDSTVISLFSNIDECDATTKELLIQELRRLGVYRSGKAGISSNYLDRLDAETRTKILEMRGKAEEILFNLK